MEGAGQTVRKTPSFPTYPEKLLRSKLIIEEVWELFNKGMGASGDLRWIDSEDQSTCTLVFTLQKTSPDDLVQVADALTDIDVVVSGTGCTYGIDLDETFEEVHRSNMSKLIEKTFNEFGKLLKGRFYSPPNLKKIISDQMNDGA
jgi:predicted HAD superfamily Cof-like phosphohydrolase